MGLLITRLTGGIEKQDINLEYETYGIEGERDYATDRNVEYDYDYDNMEETNESQGTQHTARPKVKIKCSLLKVRIRILIHSQKQRNKESVVSAWFSPVSPC